MCLRLLAGLGLNNGGGMLILDEACVGDCGTFKVSAGLPGQVACTFCGIHMLALLLLNIGVASGNGDGDRSEFGGGTMMA